MTKNVNNNNNNTLYMLQYMYSLGAELFFQLEILCQCSPVATGYSSFYRTAVVGSRPFRRHRSRNNNAVG